MSVERHFTLEIMLAELCGLIVAFGLVSNMIAHELRNFII